MLSFETIEPQHPVDSTVILLHGLGATGFDLMDVIPMLSLPSPHGIRFIFPHAPTRPITINGGYQMPGWYDITGFSQDSRQDLEGLQQSYEQIKEVIEHEINRGIKPERIILAGFSQGGAVTLFTGLQLPYALAGLIVLSAYLPCADYVMQMKQQINVPIFMANGTQDPVVQYQWGEMARDLLVQQGCNIEWHSYPIAHQVSQEELQDIAKFIQQRLGL